MPTSTQTREQLQKRGSLHFYHWMVVGLSLLVTIFAWWMSERQVEARVLARFERESSQVVELVAERMGSYEDGLWGGVAMLNTHGNQADFRTFSAFARRLQLESKYPGTLGLGVIEQIDEAQLPAYLERQRRDFPNFDIHPQVGSDVQYPISFVEPVAKNWAAVGLDVGHERNRLAAFEKARDSGQAQITGPIMLVQDQAQTPGFLFYAPYYDGPSKTLEQRRSHIAGAVYAPFIVRDLMAGTLARHNRHVTFSIHDGQTLLYDEHLFGDDVDTDPLFTTAVEVPLYGRTWKFDIRTNLSFRTASISHQPRTILFAGIAIDGMLLLLFFSLARNNSRALSLADSLTMALERKAATLERSSRDLEQLSYLASHDLKSPLRGIRALATFVQEDASDRLEDTSMDHLNKIHELTEQMTRLLDEMMKYASAINDGSTPQRTSFTVPQLVADICRFNGIDEKDVEVVGHAGPVELSQLAFKSVLNNLISNALKYGTSPKGKPICTVRTALKSDRLVLSVRDYGKGIPPGKEEEIFEIFRQLQPRSAESGSGIGLAVVKRLLAGVGGQVWVERPADGGAEFIVEWPLSES